MFKVFFQGGKRLPIETIEKTLLKEPTFVKARIKKDLKAEFIGFLGFSGLVIYTIFLSYFILVKLQRQGRSATGN